MSNSCDGSILAGCLRAGPELRSEPSREGRASVSCNRAGDGLPRDTDICGLAVLGLGAVTRFIEMAENAPMESVIFTLCKNRRMDAVDAFLRARQRRRAQLLCPRLGHDGRRTHHCARGLGGCPAPPAMARRNGFATIGPRCRVCRLQRRTRANSLRDHVEYLISSQDLEA